MCCLLKGRGADEIDKRNTSKSELVDSVFYVLLKLQKHRNTNHMNTETQSSQKICFELTGQDEVRS